MKRVLAITTLVILLAGCSREIESNHEKVLSNEQWLDVAEEVMNEVDLPALRFLSEEEINHLMEIDTENIKSALVMVPMMKVHTTQILVFQIKESKMELVKEAVDVYFEGYEKQWSSYLSDQHVLVENRLEKKIGNTLIVIVAEDVKTIESKIMAALNK